MHLFFPTFGGPEFLAKVRRITYNFGLGLNSHVGLIVPHTTFSLRNDIVCFMQMSSQNVFSPNMLRAVGYSMGLASAHVAKRHKGGRRCSLRVGADVVVRHDFGQSKEQRRLPETTVQSQYPQLSKI